MSRDVTVDTEEEIGEHSPNSNGSHLRVRIPFPVHDDLTIEFLAEITNLDEPLYNVITSDTFEEYAKLALRPDFTKVSKKELRRKIVETYCNSMKALKEWFNKLHNRVVVSCDLWSSFEGNDRYVCVICHWVNDDFTMENRVIGFKILYVFDFGDIAGKVIEVLEEFGLKGKVGSISFEDSVSKEKCMEYLGNEFDPKVLEMFAIDRSFANVVDLCGQQIVDGLALFIDPIRELVKWFRSSPYKRKEFGTLCKEMGLKRVRFCLDWSKDWRSTLDNLKAISTYPYRDILTKLYNDCPNRSPLEDSNWDAISSIIKLLEKFAGISDKFKWVSDASCHLVIEDCITIVHSLKIYESDSRFCSVVTATKSKWLELFPEIPMIYCVATILDPRMKLEGLRQLLAYYYESVGVTYDVDEKVATCTKALQQLYAQYAPPRDYEAEMAAFSGEVIKISSSLEFNVKKNLLKRKRVDDQEQSGELGQYLFFQSIIPDYDDDEYFDILDWWKRRRYSLKVLPNIAKDILCIPLSTTIPKPKCCPGKRVLDEKRSMLKPDLIQVCICKSDCDLQGEEDNVADDALTSSDSDTDD